MSQNPVAVSGVITISGSQGFSPINATLSDFPIPLAPLIHPTFGNQAFTTTLMGPQVVITGSNNFNPVIGPTLSDFPVILSTPPAFIGGSLFSITENNTYVNFIPGNVNIQGSVPKGPAVVSGVVVVTYGPGIGNFFTVPSFTNFRIYPVFPQNSTIFPGDLPDPGI